MHLVFITEGRLLLAPGVAASDAEHLTVPRTSPTVEKCLVPNAKSAKAENPGLGIIILSFPLFRCMIPSD